MPRFSQELFLGGIFRKAEKKGVLIGKAINTLVSLLIFMIEDHCLLSLGAEIGVFLQRNRKLEAHKKMPIFVVFQISVQ